MGTIQSEIHQPDTDGSLRREISEKIARGETTPRVEFIRTLVQYNCVNSWTPISLNDNILVMSFAHDLREARDKHKQDVWLLINDFRASLSRLSQIVFDIHIKSKNDFLASFTGFDNLAPKN